MIFVGWEDKLCPTFSTFYPLVGKAPVFLAEMARIKHTIYWDYLE